MEIDVNQGSLEIHKSIFEKVLALGLKRKFKPIEHFEDRWYRESDDGPFILFPHPSITDPDEAISGCAYPNVWIRHIPATGELEYGIAYWSAPSVEQRFVNFAHPRNWNHKDRLLAILKGLPDTWLFRIYKKKKKGPDESVYENKCNLMGQEEILKAISDVQNWRTQWKKEAVPAIHLMRGIATTADSDQNLRDLFTIFDELVEMTTLKQIKDESKAAMKSLQAQIDNLNKNLETSQYKPQIQSRLKSLRMELAEYSP